MAFAKKAYKKSKWKRKVRGKKKMKLYKPVNTRPALFKEKIRAEYTMTANADGMAIVNEPSTLIRNNFPDATMFDDVNQSAQYATLWKMYQIKGVKYQFFPFHTNSLTNSNGITINNELKWLWYKYQKAGQIEPNPVEPITDAMYNQGIKFIQFNKPLTLYFKNPRAVSSVWDGSSSTASNVEAVLPADSSNKWHATDVV